MGAHDFDRFFPSLSLAPFDNKVTRCYFVSLKMCLLALCIQNTPRYTDHRLRMRRVDMSKEVCLIYCCKFHPCCDICSRTISLFPSFSFCFFFLFLFVFDLLSYFFAEHFFWFWSVSLNRNISYTDEVSSLNVDNRKKAREKKRNQNTARLSLSGGKKSGFVLPTVGFLWD